METKLSEIPLTASGWSIDSLRLYLETLVNTANLRWQERLEASEKLTTSLFAEREKAMTTAFVASEKAVAAAFAASEKAVAAAFAASGEASVKYEAAQANYNIRSNEFRGQLDDQAKTLMPRSETDERFKAVDARFDAFRVSYEEKHVALQKEFDDKLLVSTKAARDKTEALETVSEEKLLAHVGFDEKNFMRIDEEIKLLRDSNNLRSGRAAVGQQLTYYVVLAVLAVIAALMGHFLK
jgi:hypothetical protein